MHLLALGLSYMREEVSNDAASLLLAASEREILHTIIGYCSVGIHRTLQKLPGKVISRANVPTRPDARHLGDERIAGDKAILVGRPSVILTC